MTACKLATLAFAASALTGSASSLSAQAFEGVVTMRVASMTGELQVYLKGGKTRLEMQSPAGPVAILADPTAGEQYIVITSQKMYMVMKTEDARAAADSMVKSKLGLEGSLTPTGRTDRVAGHECEIYRAAGSKGVKDVCVAKGLGPLEAFATLLNPMGGMGAMGRSPRGEQSLPPWARELARIKGFPLRIADTVGVSEWEITRMERKPLEAALFKLPEGYRRMDLGAPRPPLE